MATGELETSLFPGIIIMLGIGTISALIVGALYGIAMFYMNFIILNILVAFLCVMLIAVFAIFGGNTGKVNSRSAHTMFGLIFGLVAVYSSWVIWLYAVSGWDLWVLPPSEILEIAVMISDIGVWSIFGFTPTGNLLLTFWGIEAITIAGLAAYLTGQLRTTVIQNELSNQ